MADIFKEIKKSSNEEIANQLAILKVINLKNLTKVEVNRVSRGFMKGANFFGKFIGKELNNLEKITIEDILATEINNLQFYSREKLDYDLKELVKNKLNSSDNNITDEMLSSFLINEVSKKYKLSDFLTNAQKADIIFNEVYTELLNQAQKKLNKQNKNEKGKTVESIDTSINKLSTQEQEDLKNLLEVDELSGEIIREVLMKSGKPAIIIAALSASGFGGYIALTTIIHAIFTSMLSITLPFAFYTSATSLMAILTGPIGFLFVLGLGTYQLTNGQKKLDRDLLSQLIFLARILRKSKFTPSDEELPYYSLSSLEKNEITKLGREYLDIENKYNKLKNDNVNLQNKIAEFNKKIQNNNVEIEKKDKIINESRDLLKQLKVDKEIKEIQLQNGIKELDKLKENYNDTENKAKKLSDDIIVLKEILDEKTQNISKEEKYIEDLYEELEQYDNRNTELKDKIRKSENDNRKKSEMIDSQRKKLNNKENSLKEKITKKWNVYFNKFIFEKQAIRDIIKFHEVSISKVEKALMTLHACDDYCAESRGKMLDRQNRKVEHMEVSLYDGFPTRIYYMVTNNSNKPVIITEIVKHNEKWTQ
jgi:uncharacterized coiled-coil DUF342 family protein